jgi:hypothetical protein
LTIKYHNFGNILDYSAAGEMMVGKSKEGEEGRRD